MPRAALRKRGRTPWLRVLRDDAPVLGPPRSRACSARSERPNRPLVQEPPIFVPAGRPRGASSQSARAPVAWRQMPPPAPQKALLIPRSMTPNNPTFTRSLTGLVLPLALHRLLRDAARGRQRVAGGRGRASVSALVSELIEKHRAELESDARRGAPGKTL